MHKYYNEVSDKLGCGEEMSRNEFTRTRDIISNLGDPRAVVREWKDTGGDTVKIEVFYGGRDGGDSDGHGHYVAEKIDGLFQTTLDRHPDIEDGGRHEIEFNRESSRDAYNNEARQDRIQRKQAIIQQITCLDYEDPQCINRIRELESEFYNVGSCGHDDNIFLKNEFRQVKDNFITRRNEYLQQLFTSIWTEKENIINEAQSLLYVTDSNRVRNEMNRLFSRWRELPRTTREKDEELWERFNSIRTEIREKLQKEIEKRKAEQQAAKLKKESIVSRAESIAYSTDFRAAKDEMKLLMGQWKMLPRASRQEEDFLWERFSKAKDDLFNRAKQDYEKRQLEYRTAKARKESIISQAESLCSTSDFRSASDQMKNLSQQFYDAGNAGRDNQDLKNRFNNARQRFYEAKRIASELRHREHLQRLQDRLFEKQQSLSNLDDAIYRTQQSISELISKPDPSYSNPHRFEIAARRNDRLSNLNERLRRMGENKLKLINQISDLQSKMNR